MFKKLIISIIVIVVLAAGIYQVFLKKEKLTYTLAEVKRGDILQEVSETGQVEKGEKISLNFQNAGKIQNIYAKVGENVEKGDILARLETSSLQIQLKDAKAALSLAEAQLDKLMAGASQEEIKVSQTAVETSRISLNAATQDLEDAYQDALNVLNDSYIKAYNAKNSANLVQRTYFINSDQESTAVREQEGAIESNVLNIKSYIDDAQINSVKENIDINLTKVKNKLSNTLVSLTSIRETCEAVSYRNLVSSTDKTSLDTHRTNINTAIASIIGSEQSIVSARLNIQSAQSGLQQAQDDLALTTAAPRKEDIDLYEAKVEQAKAQTELLKNQIQNTNLIAPIAGQIAEINKKEGEMVQAAFQDSVISILPDSPYQVKINVYEEDVVKIKIDNETEISLVAFPDQTFKGKVISIYPAENLIDGVVYYKVIIAINEPPEGIKSGMTADVVIKTAQKENVLIIPEGAVQKKDGRNFIQISENGNLQEREVVLGISGTDNMVEIISGLQEGEKVVLQ